MFFLVARFTLLSFIRQGYYQGYYHFSALFGIKFLLSIHVVLDAFLCGKIYSVVYYPTRILYHYIIVLYYYIIYYIILLLCCRRYFSRWQDLLSITRQGYYPRSGRAVKLKPKGDSTSRLHPVWMEHQFVRNLGEWQHHQRQSRRVMMKHSQVSCLQTGLGGAV